MIVIGNNGELHYLSKELDKYNHDSAREYLTQAGRIVRPDIDEKTTRARAIIVNSNKEVLMCYSNGRNHYEFPGGHLEFGENLIEGLKRELLEETGIEIAKENAIPFYSIKYYCKNYHGTERDGR